MDTLSHAAWGYAVLNRRGRPLALAGALAGALPDLLYFIPSRIEQIVERGWSGLFIGREPGIWRANGPPMPPELIEAYHRYYVATHSLVLLGVVVLILLVSRARRWAWLGLPYALHIAMDIPTHERYLTQPLYPLSDWTFVGLAWVDPRIFWPNVAALALTYGWIWWGRRARRAVAAPAVEGDVSAGLGAAMRAPAPSDRAAGPVGSESGRRTSPDTGLAAIWLVLALAGLGASSGCGGAATGVEAAGQPHQGPPPIVYRLSFPEPEHRTMHVTVVFRDLSREPLDVRMSRASPGRYALHEFAKNVFDVRAADGSGRPLAAHRVAPHRWMVGGHDGTVRFQYRVFGDRLDGTYLAIDDTHAHINIPAALVWARGLEDRPVRVEFEQPPGRRWRAATQLYPTSDPLAFTAPNFQYLMDSPVEFSAFALTAFTVPQAGGRKGPLFRIALHHDGDDAALERFSREVERLVREAQAVFGEFPDFETGSYTFLADYLPYASPDGMEHRNSTVLTAPVSLETTTERSWILGTAVHEFVHSWNVERIRPRSLEPFNFEDANVSGELWFAEGVTSYYDALLMQRAGLATLDETAATFGRWIETVATSPGRQFGSAVDMSRLAPLVDAAVSVDRTNWDNIYISYYTWGAAIGLALDLALREKSGGRVTLDDYMRALWAAFGRPGGRAPGLVDRPYTLEDLKGVLGRVAGDEAFAREFFARYIEGRALADYQRLLAQAGLVVRRRAPGRATLGRVEIERAGTGVKLRSAAQIDSPLYAAGLDRDDVIERIGHDRVTSRVDWDAALARHRPGAAVSVTTVSRSGARRTVSAQLIEDGRIEVVPIERTGGTLTPAARRFREAWLGSQIRSAEERRQAREASRGILARHP